MPIKKCNRATFYTYKQSTCMYFLIYDQLPVKTHVPLYRIFSISDTKIL